MTIAKRKVKIIQRFFFRVHIKSITLISHSNYIYKEFTLRMDKTFTQYKDRKTTSHTIRSKV